MPLYEYLCDSCGHRFEAIQKFSDPPLVSCPKCAAGLRKLQSAPAIQFKGAGWYITDYAKKDSVSAGKSGDGSRDDGSTGAAKSNSDASTPASTDTAAPAPAATAPVSPPGDK